MSIRSISGLSPGLGFAPPRPGRAGGRRAYADPAEPVGLTWDDREVIAAMFAADGVPTDLTVIGGREPGSAVAFAALVTEDRRTGRLPAGSQMTGTYLQAIWAGQHSADADSQPGTPGMTSPLLTEVALAAGLTFLAQRPQGATLDIRA